MIRNTLIAGLLLGLSVTALADPNVISRGYELSLADFRPPATENGGVTFRTCSDCEFMTLRVGPQTRYTLDGRPIKLDDLRVRLLGFRDRESVFVGVLHHLESGTAQLIAVSSPE